MTEIKSMTKKINVKETLLFNIQESNFLIWHRGDPTNPIHVFEGFRL